MKTISGISQEQKNKVPYYWAMTRFLKYGRVIDTLKLFNIKEIIENLDKLQLPDYAVKKWKRMGEVFDKLTENTSCYAKEEQRNVLLHLLENEKAEIA